MIDGLTNEIAGAFAQLIADRDGITEDAAREICAEAEETDSFWNAVNTLADEIWAGYLLDRPASR